MSVLSVSSRAHKRLVTALITALVAALSVISLGPAPQANAAVGTLSFVGSSNTAGNRTNHTVTIPSGVSTGDTLLLFLTTNSTTSTINNPAGWTLIQSRDGNAIRGRAYTRVAVTGDAGDPVTITTTAAAKSSMSLSAYRSSVIDSSVTASASAVGNTSTSSLAAPQVAVAETNSWLVNYWSEKSSTTTTFTLPAGVTSRGTAASTGTGKVSGILGDSAAAVPVGTAAARTATLSAPASRNALFSVVVSPGETSGNRPPVVSFTTNCVTSTCSFDASASSDPDNDPLTYSWSWGDGTPAGSGVSPSHTYATSGTRTVTLTVSDGTTTATGTSAATTAAAVPGPGHGTRLVPAIPRTNTPLISAGEMWDIEVIGDRAFVVGGFTTVRNNSGTNTTSYTQRQLVAWSLTTGLVDPSFRPTFTGSVDSVEASPDGTKLFVSGTFSAVNGVAKQNVVSLNPTTGATVSGFTATTDGRVNELAVSNSTVYLGGRFTRVNGLVRRSLGAVNSTTGAVVTGFVNNVSGGIGVSGALGIQRLLLSHDQRTLVVVHTGRQVNGQDRYGVALISAVTNQLLPWHTRLWEDNLQFVGGIQRAYAGAIGVDDSYFVVGSGSGGDRPPINDTVMAFPMDGGADTKPLWISRQFDSIYSLATAENAIYVGGHFAWNESPTSRDPWPGLDDVGYGTGQGLSGYSLGDEVVRRDHLGAISPTTGKALEWNPGSNSAEGDKAMEVTPRGLIVGGDGQTKGGYNVGRIAFFDFNSVAAPNGNETRIVEPIEGRVEAAGEEFEVTGTATATSGVNRVQMSIFDRESRRYLADDLTTWGTTSNSVNVNLASPGATSTSWSLKLTIPDNRKIELKARTYGNNGTSDNTVDSKKIETFGVTDRPPTTSVSAPSTSVVTTQTFTIGGSASDDFGVNSVGVVVKDSQDRYLQDDGSVSGIYHTFRVEPDVVGALSTTWSLEVTLPTEGNWTAQARASDTTGQSALDTANRTWLVTSSGVAPTVSITAPVSMVPPTAAQPVTVAPGGPITFSGNATDDEGLNRVEITLRNNSNGERLASDGSWGDSVQAGNYRISPQNLDGTSHNWSYTTPFNLKPGSYSFTVRATDDLGIETSSSYLGRLTVNASFPGDAPPNALLDTTGTITGGQVLHLDLTGTATDDVGVKQVLVSLRDNISARYLQPNGTLAAAFATRQAVLASPGATSTTWTLSVDLPTEGDWAVTALGYDTMDQQDTSTTGATARYPIYPGDLPPTVTQSLMAPQSDAVFNDGRIFISGRVEDDRQIASAQVAVVDSLGRYMSSTGTFTSTTVSYRTAFLNSPGSLGSNYSYTTPIIPTGVYRVLVRGTDHHGLTTPTPAEATNVTVNTPASNAPVANFTVSCTQNVCDFDARSSTDENTPTLTYSWNFGNGSGTGPVPKRTYTSPGTFDVVLTARDEYGLTSTATKSVTIVEPTGNVAPNPVINQPACANLVCNISGVGSADPNTGDTFTYLWNFGDGTTSTSSAMSHTFPTAGTYTLTLTTTDGWGKAATTTRQVTVTAP